MLFIVFFHCIFHPRRRKLEVMKHFASTDQADKRIRSEQHRRPDAPQTLQDETRGGAAEPGRRERAGEEHEDMFSSRCAGFSLTFRFFSLFLDIFSPPLAAAGSTYK